MKRYAILFLSGLFIFSFLILTAADKNGDGKLSMDECMSISKNKKKIEKDCKYWDADGNGVITEDEYVKQVLKIMR